MRFSSSGFFHKSIILGPLVTTKNFFNLFRFREVIAIIFVNIFAKTKIFSNIFYIHDIHAKTRHQKSHASVPLRPKGIFIHEENSLQVSLQGPSHKN